MAASGECGGGLGAVAPAVGDEGPQQVAPLVPLVDVDVAEDDDEEGDPDEDWVEELLEAAAAGESPTTSISSSSSRTSTTTWGGGGGEGDAGDSSTRSGHG